MMIGYNGDIKHYNDDLVLQFMEENEKFKEVIQKLDEKITTIIIETSQYYFKIYQLAPKSYKSLGILKANLSNDWINFLIENAEYKEEYIIKLLKWSDKQIKTKKKKYENATSKVEKAKNELIDALFVHNKCSELISKMNVNKKR